MNTPVASGTAKRWYLRRSIHFGDEVIEYMIASEMADTDAIKYLLTRNRTLPTSQVQQQEMVALLLTIKHGAEYPDELGDRIDAALAGCVAVRVAS